MLLLEEDLYIDCHKQIEEANELYELIKTKNDIDSLHLLYFQDANKYINNYKTFRIKLIKTFIEDLRKLFS